MSHAYPARGVSVYDGRSARIRIDVPPTGLSLEVDVVLAGLDAPELIGPEAELGQRARAALSELVVGRDLQASIEATAPLRPLAASMVLVNDNAPTPERAIVDVVDEMIRLGHGRPLVGGERPPWPTAVERAAQP